MKEKIANSVSAYPEGIKEEIAELRIKYRLSAENRRQLTHFKDFYKRQMLKGNPMMVSKRFGDMLRELQENLDGRKEPYKKDGKDENENAG